LIVAARRTPFAWFLGALWEAVLIDWDNLVLAPCLAAFGETETATADNRPIYTPAAGEAFAVVGVFTDAFEELVILDDGAPGYVTHKPTLGVRDSQWLGAEGQIWAEGDHVFVPRKNQNYLVNAPKPDGQGHTLLQLNESAT
jgi:hypothetical protein